VDKATNPHSYFMNRLAHELQLRQRYALPPHCVHVSLFPPSGFRLFSRSMNEELVDMSGKMKSLSDEIAEKRKFLDSVSVHLKGIEKVTLLLVPSSPNTCPSRHACPVVQSTKPLQKYFGQNVSKQLAKQSNSAGLPGPLYVLFTQLEALEDISGGTDGDITVSVQNASHPHSGSAGTVPHATSKKRGGMLTLFGTACVLCARCY
jgi:hypothetical protein